MHLTSAIWRKSTRSSGNGGACVEVADNLPHIIGIRDSKHPTGPALVVPADGWASFVKGVKRDTYDR